MISPRHSKSPDRIHHYSRGSEGWQTKDQHRPSPMNVDTKLSSPKPPGKPTLAQAIFDEFLVCKICLEGYKSPKCLECLHTFCEQCIDSHVSSESSYKKYSDYREFTCPLCRKRTQLPLGGCKKLPDNFLVSNLSEMVGRQRPSKFPFCDFCKLVENKFREAHAKCLDCAKMLCVACVTDHQAIKVTSAHSIFDVDIEKDIGCKEHPDETVRYYCVPCETCVCVVCTFKDHRQHKVTQFSEAVTAYRDIMHDLVDQCKVKINNFDAHIASLTKCESVITDVREKIKETAASFVMEIHRREHVLLEELNNIYGRDCIELIDRKSDLSNQVESLRSTCKLAETILHGKDIELLLLRKDVQDKLTLLNQGNDGDLPSTVDKVVNFRRGVLDFGSLFDQGRSLTPNKTERSNTVKTASGNLSIEASVIKFKKLSPLAVGSMKKIIIDSSDDDDDDDDDDDASSDDSSGSDSDGKPRGGKKRAMRNHAVQTEDFLTPMTSMTVGLARRAVTAERSTFTDVVSVQDKAVNTKARSMLKNNNSSSSRPESSLQLENPPAQNVEEKKIRVIRDLGWPSI